MILDTKEVYMEPKSINRKFKITGFFSSYSFSWDSDFVFNGERHEMWEIVFVQSGRVEVTENEKVYQLEKNNMIIHAPGEFHRIRSAAGTSPNLCVMSFFADGELPPKLLEGIFILSADQSLQYNLIFGRIDKFLNSKSTSSYAGQDAADRLSAFLIEMSGENVTAFWDTSLAATEYRKLVLVMSGAVCENRTLSDFALECGDSVSYIKQLFKKYAGISPKSYYNNLRINYASKLLKEGAAVKEIAEKMNFSSSNYFSAFFKKHTSISPFSYKNT